MKLSLLIVILIAPPIAQATSPEHLVWKLHTSLQNSKSSSARYELGVEYLQDLNSLNMAPESTRKCLSGVSTGHLPSSCLPFDISARMGSGTGGID